MDKITHYRQAIKSVISHHAKGGYINADEYEAQTVFDDEHGHYFLYGVGWVDQKRLHGCTLHLDLKNDKIWIQEDWTEDGIANELEAAGVPKQDIVLAFRSPVMRQFTEYAVA